MGLIYNLHTWTKASTDEEICSFIANLPGGLTKKDISVMVMKGGDQVRIAIKVNKNLLDPRNFNETFYQVDDDNVKTAAFLEVAKKKKNGRSNNKVEGVQYIDLPFTCEERLHTGNCWSNKWGYSLFLDEGVAWLSFKTVGVKTNFLAEEESSEDEEILELNKKFDSNKFFKTPTTIPTGEKSKDDRSSNQEHRSSSGKRMKTSRISKKSPEIDALKSREGVQNTVNRTRKVKEPYLLEKGQENLYTTADSE